METKEVSPLTFDNGVMVSSLKELKGVLMTMDNGIFKTHVNDKKHDIADWIIKNFSKEFGEKLKEIKIKSALIKELESFGKPVVKKEEPIAEKK